MFLVYNQTAGWYNTTWLQSILMFYTLLSHISQYIFMSIHSLTFAAYQMRPLALFFAPFECKIELFYAL